MIRASLCGPRVEPEQTFLDKKKHLCISLRARATAAVAPKDQWPRRMLRLGLADACSHWQIVGWQPPFTTTIRPFSLNARFRLVGSAGVCLFPQEHFKQLRDVVAEGMGDEGVKDLLTTTKHNIGGFSPVRFLLSVLWG